jgi:hypothetical protein
MAACRGNALRHAAVFIWCPKSSTFPLVGGDVSLPKNLPEQGPADGTRVVRIGNANLEAPFLHELVPPSGNGTLKPQGSQLTDQFPSRNRFRHESGSFDIEIDPAEFRKRIAVPDLEKQPFFQYFL